MCYFLGWQGGRYLILALVVSGENNMECGERFQLDSDQHHLFELMEKQTKTVEKLLANLQVSDSDHVKKEIVQ